MTPPGGKTGRFYERSIFITKNPIISQEEWISCEIFQHFADKEILVARKRIFLREKQFFHKKNRFLVKSFNIQNKKAFLVRKRSF